ncbi:hypothetical protein SAY86_031228 [Trapa natans]|uniref:Homeobox-leucine zipper protein n=1 Tax=Trapa natans TaxID=22666 RepID=A0AAN7LRF7_TRANT|nr:hypothetical protein SAY86_031228 [Trapa natans]
MTTAIEDQVEADPHGLLMISQLFPGAYAQYHLPPLQSQGPKPRRQRRKKNRGGDGSSSGGVKKRKLSDEQVRLLEQNFGNEHKLESERKDRLASELGLDPRQVAVWFQNRRARWKNKRLEEEYARLKSIHETTVLDKCHLETEIIQLQEKLAEATKEIQRLSVSSPAPDFGVSGNSPISSSISDMGQQQTDFMGEFGILQEYHDYHEDVFHIAAPGESDYYNQTLNWYNTLV